MAVMGVQKRKALTPSRILLSGTPKSKTKSLVKLPKHMDVHSSVIVPVLESEAAKILQFVTPSV